MVITSQKQNLLLKQFNVRVYKPRILNQISIKINIIIGAGFVSSELVRGITQEIITVLILSI